MIAETFQTVLAQGGELGTGGIRGWLVDNIVPLALLAVAMLLLFLGGGRGDNAGVMRRLVPVFIGLGVLGFAVTNAGVPVGTWIAGLFTG